MVKTHPNQTETEIMSIFLRAPRNIHSVSELSRLTKRYISQVQGAVKSLEAKGALKVRKLGPKSSCCSMNLSGAAEDLLVIGAQHSKRELLQKYPKIGVIAEEISLKLSELCIALVFGSHAKGSAKPDSDIDLCFIVESEAEVEKLRARLKAITARFSYKIHAVVFTSGWFYTMLGQKESVGREIFLSSVALQGYDLYYRLVKRHDREAGD